MPGSVAESASSAPGPSSANKYVKVRDINAGTFGLVVEARHRDTGQHWAIKYIPRGAAVNKYVAREIVHHSCMVHPHIVAFREAFLTEDHLGIVMEYVNGGNMAQYMRKRRSALAEDEARWFFQQLVMAVSYCHAMGVVNRDIKLENALLEDLKRPILKLSDFGYSKHERDSRPKTWVGTPGYTAPEVMFSNQDYDGKKADVWSSGVFLCVLLFCEYPFGLPDAKAARNADLFASFLQRLQDPAAGGAHAALSADARSLLLQMLRTDPSARISMAEVCTHPWFTRDLPPAALRMNDDCLRLSGLGRGPGSQTPKEIQAVLAEAMAPLAQDAAALDDDVIRRPLMPAGCQPQEEDMYQEADGPIY